MNIKLIVDDDFRDGIFLEPFLKKQHFSLKLRRRLKYHGKIFVNDELISSRFFSKTILFAGDELLIELEENNKIECINNENQIDVPIIFEDDYFLIVNKPAGLLVHPAPTKQTYQEFTLANFVMDYYRKTNQNLIFHPVHRLDRKTTGLVLIAKTPQMHHALKEFHREYLAIAHGIFENSSGEIFKKIARCSDSIIQRKIAENDEEGQEAKTIYHTLKTMTYENERVSLCQVIPVTGRTHQIRVHFASEGHPLLGDDLYGGSQKFFKRQALHAYKLSFLHPVLKKIISVTCDLPDDFKKFLEVSV